MNTLARNLVLITTLMSLGACTATTRGTRPIVTADGPTAEVSAANAGVEKKFKTAEEAAVGVVDDNGTAAKAMMTAGFALIYANCNDYLASAGKTQKWIYFSRDLIGAIGTIATGIMALHGSSENAVANVGFTTGAAFAGLDIYTKNFLFSAENIDSVRELVLKALAVHSAAVPLGNDTYETATLALLDNQNICTPMAITALVREAIKKGDVVASNAGDPLQVFFKAQDDAVLADLGKVLRPPGSLKMEQATALWWLLRGQTTKDQRQKVIFPVFKDFDTDKNPIDATTFAYKIDWLPYSSVNSLLGAFSAPTQTLIRENVAIAEAVPAAPAATPAASGGNPAAKAGIPKSASSALLAPKNAVTRRVSVGIR